MARYMHTAFCNSLRCMLLSRAVQRGTVRTVAYVPTDDPLGLEPAGTELPDDAVQQTEYALWRRSTGMTISKDVQVKDSKLTLETELAPDVAAAKLFLQAHKPDVYGDSAQPIRAVVLVTDARELRASLAATQEKNLGRVIEHDPRGAFAAGPGAEKGNP